MKTTEKSHEAVFNQLLALLTAAFFLSGCIQDTSEKQSVAVLGVGSSESPAAYMLTTPRWDVTDLYTTNALRIADASLVQSLSQKLRTAKPEPIRIFTLVPPRPIVFVDTNMQIVAAYEYYPGAVPEYVLRPAKFEKIGPQISLHPMITYGASKESTGLVLRDFEDLVKPYMVLHP